MYVNTVSFSFLFYYTFSYMYGSRENRYAYFGVLGTLKENAPRDQFKQSDSKFTAIGTYYNNAILFR